MPSEQNVKACFLVIEFPSAKRGKKKKKSSRREFESTGEKQKIQRKKKKRKQVKKKIDVPPSAGRVEKAQNTSDMP